jgi:hypothetical protein
MNVDFALGFRYPAFFNFVAIFRDFHRKGAKNAKKFVKNSKAFPKDTGTVRALGGFAVRLLKVSGSQSWITIFGKSAQNRCLSPFITGEFYFAND